MKYLDNEGLAYLWGKVKQALLGKVDTVEGKQLSTEDFTTPEKEKLSSLTSVVVDDVAPTDENIDLWVDTSDESQIEIPEINDNSVSTQDTWSSSKISTELQNLINIIYPIGSIYTSVSEVSPTTLFGGTWEKIEDRFLLAAGSVESGAESETGISSEVTVNIPAHRHLTPLISSGTALGLWTDGVSMVRESSSRLGVDGTSYTDSGTYQTYYTATDGACSADVIVPPTIPPYLAVHMWKRVG